MNNPFTPPESSPEEAQESIRWGILWSFVTIVVGGVVLANFLTADQVLWVIKPFRCWVFVTSPMAIASSVVLLFPRYNLIPLRISVFVATTILLMFGYLLSRWFSPNPYEAFAISHEFLGDEGWLLWLWFFFTGLLPFLYLAKSFRDSHLLRCSLSSVVILAYLHNAAFVISGCHSVVPEF